MNTHIYVFIPCFSKHYSFNTPIPKKTLFSHEGTNVNHEQWITLLFCLLLVFDKLCLPLRVLHSSLPYDIHVYTCALF